jgi:hypothetical protein
MTSKVDTFETEATARQMALEADTEVDRLAFWECAQAIAQERARAERAEEEAKKWKDVAAREWERARKAEDMLA